MLSEKKEIWNIQIFKKLKNMRPTDSYTLKRS